MASITLHLIVIALLAAAALTTAATNTSAATAAAATTAATAATRQRSRGGGVGAKPDMSMGMGVRVGVVVGRSVASTTSTQAPTLRAPRQRRPPTTQSIDATESTASTGPSLRRRGLARGTAGTQAVSTLATPPLMQRRRNSGSSSSSSSTTAPIETTKAGRLLRDRGRVRSPRQLRSSSDANEAGSSVRRTWQPAPTTATNALEQSSLYSHRSTPSNAVDSSSGPTSNSTRGGTLKTPRMIQRLVAGHIHNAQGHSTYEVSSVSANSSSSSSPDPRPSTSPPTYTSTSSTTSTTRRPAMRGKASSSYRLAKPIQSSSPATIRISNPSSTSRSTITPALPGTKTLLHNASNNNGGHDDEDDEALLNEPDDFDNWDHGILRLSAGSGKEADAPAKIPPKDEAKKTLADQVRDGKYGLIEKELFRRVPKRPGVLSYTRNSEVPLDNERNYGGLNEEDIWLAEDHLLVIKGGALNEEELEDNRQPVGPWPAIDDYDAPGRQIKLPDNPAVPPPFPVQLDPNGPLQIIRDNQLKGHYPAAGNGTESAGYHLHPQAEVAGKDFTSPHTLARAGAPAETDGPPPYVYQTPPYAPWLLYPNETLAKNLLRSPPLLGPWLINGLNNGSLAPGNASDFDEDDPSLYYPPAYSFVYHSNYSNPVPPGPLVPGIVLPPPPDQFSRLEGSSTSTRRPLSSSSSTYTSTPSTTTSTTTSSTTSTTTRTPPTATLPPIRTSFKPKYSSNAINAYLPPSPARNPSASVSSSPPKYVERVPVPVAVPIPIYPVNYTPRPQLVFVPSSTEGQGQDVGQGQDPPLSKSNPIYYEYFEAKRHPGSIKSNVIDDFLATKPPKRHHHQPSHSHSHGQYREQLQHYKASPSPINDVVNITPKPRTAQLQLHAEYEASLGQLLKSNLITPPAQAATADRFQAPDFDKQPFLPMVNYSADEHDQNAFRAIVYQPPSSRHRHLRVGKQQLQLPDSSALLHPSAALSGGHYRVGKQQQQLQQLHQKQQVFDPQLYSTPVPQFLEDPQLRPPAPVPQSPMQFWQRAPPQFKRIRPKQGSHIAHIPAQYPPYFVSGYPSAPATEPLYRLVPVSQHKHWRNKQPQLQSQNIQNQGYPDRSVNIGHSLAGDILVNYNTNNQFNPQAELVPHAQLAAPPPPLSYQAQSGQPLWSERSDRSDRSERDRDRERSVRQSREQQP